MADKLTEILIYFMVIFSPWAFGTTEPWSVWTMNISAYALGILLVTKWITRLATKYNPNPEPKKNELSLKQNRLRLIQKTCTILLAGSMFLLLAYIITSAINARASFNLETKEYIYFTNFNKNLPHSYDAKATWFLFWQYLGLILLFWSTKDWLAGATTSRNSFSFNPRLKKLLHVACINAGILAFECILQRLHYDEFKGKLLFLLEPSINKLNLTQFGPFAYRSNAATFFNLIWPIGLGILLQTARTPILSGKKKIGTGSELFMIPFIILIASCPIISSARGGTFIMVGLLVLVTLSIPLLRIKSKLVFISLTVCILMAMLTAFHFGWVKLETRLMTTFTDSFNSRKQIFEATNRMIDFYVFSNIPPSPFGSGPGSYQSVVQFELDEKLSSWQTWAHNDYLETLLTFGLPGSMLVLFIIMIFLLNFVLISINKNQVLFTFYAILALIGVLVHAIGDFPLQVYSIQLIIIIILSIIQTEERSLNGEK